MVSYADPDQDHHGGIYQAANWIYMGTSQPQRETLREDGSILHKRTAHSRYGTIVGLKLSRILWKHKYIYAFDKELRTRFLSLSKPYPKRAASDTIEGPRSIDLI